MVHTGLEEHLGFTFLGLEEFVGKCKIFIFDFFFSLVKSLFTSFWFWKFLKMLISFSLLCCEVWYLFGTLLPLMSKREGGWPFG